MIKHLINILPKIKSKKEKKISYIKNIWAKPLEKYRDFDLISSYHNLLEYNVTDAIVDEKTWNDLNFNSIFEKMDRNISGIGQQYLYHLLHKYESDENILKRRFNLVSELRTNERLRESIQLNLFNLNTPFSYHIAYLILNKSIPKTKYYPLFFLFPLVAIFSLIMISYNSIFFFFALFIFLINLIINKIFSNKIYAYFTGFSSLNSLIISAISISKVKTNIPVPEIETLKKKINLLSSLNKKLGYFVIEKESLNELALIIIEYLNMFFLFDIIAYYSSVDTLLKNQDEIRVVFECVAKLDALISVASYLEENQFHSNPTFNSSGVISFQNLYHPLIEDAIPNTVENLRNSVLITGSNMAGKTTFIKTVGINFILSQTLYFSLSKKFYIPKLIVKSAIRRNDELEEGKSYFFVEIETLNNFIKLSREKDKYLFLIDEIFRGTNTIERLAASTAVLKYLDINNKVMVTTHDIELQDLLENKFKMFHFSEKVENGKLFFDYKIKEGPCSSGNAIKLLEIMNYPYSIINEANSIAKELLLSGSLINKIKT